LAQAASNICFPTCADAVNVSAVRTLTIGPPAT
jgi:hypothetical protein